MGFIRQLLLAVISGTMVFMAFPPLEWWPCAIVAWAPLIIAVRWEPLHLSLCLGMIQGLVAYGLTLNWLVPTAGGIGAALIFMLATYNGLFCIGFTFFARKLSNPFLKALFATCLWTSIELIRSDILWPDFSWITPGYALGPVIWTPILGAYGSTFIVFLASALTGIDKSRLIGILFAFLVTVIGITRIPWTFQNTDKLTMAAVQGNTASVVDYRDITTMAIKLISNTQLVVWPEYVFPSQGTTPDSKQLNLLIQDAKQWHSIYVVGSRTALPVDLRKWYSTALVIGAEGMIGQYQKVRVNPALEKTIPGAVINPVSTPIGKIGTPISTDWDTGKVMRQMAAKGAQIFVAPSYSPPDGGETRNRQHVNMLKIRGAENARWIVSASNKGPSLIIGPNGEVEKELRFEARGVVVDEVQLLDHKTIYGYVGWLFPWICLLGTSGWIGYLTKRSR